MNSELVFAKSFLGVNLRNVVGVGINRIELCAEMPPSVWLVSFFGQNK